MCELCDGDISQPAHGPFARDSRFAGTPGAIPLINLNSPAFIGDCIAESLKGNRNVFNSTAAASIRPQATLLWKTIFEIKGEAEKYYITQEIAANFRD